MFLSTYYNKERKSNKYAKYLNTNDINIFYTFNNTWMMEIIKFCTYQKIKHILKYTWNIYYPNWLNIKFSLDSCSNHNKKIRDQSQKHPSNSEKSPKQFLIFVPSF